MQQENKDLHPKNLHKKGYNIEQLKKIEPQLVPYITTTPTGHQSIDFKNPKAVFLLNKSLLKSYYGINNWKITPNSLCPPIPGRADYIHHIADLIASDSKTDIRILDIGTGSSLIYPLIGSSVYDWNFVATDIHKVSLDNGRHILKSNPQLAKKIELRQQMETDKMLVNIIHPEEYYHAVICNPPFYKSREEHWKKVVTKNEKLHQGKDLPIQNFGGLANELWYKGGEKAFVLQMIYESFEFKNQLLWCSSMISDKDNLKPLIAVLEYHKVAEIKIIPLKQGNKVSRILAWKIG